MALDAEFDQASREHGKQRRNVPRIQRKIQGVEMKILHVQVSPEVYAWIEDCVEATQTSKAKVVELIVMQHKRKAEAKAARKAVEETGDV